MKETYSTGVRGEETAENYLEGLGMKCIEKRYRSKCGEIDLVLLDGDTLVFAEVKARLTAPEGAGLNAVDRRKQTRIARTASYYLMTHRLSGHPVRFDVVEISQDGILHIPDAFQPGGMIW